MVIFKQFTFDSAHFLSKVPATHKCSQIHGHTYKLTILEICLLQNDLDWVMDYADIKQVVCPMKMSSKC